METTLDQSVFRPKDVRATMTPDEMLDSPSGDLDYSVKYAIHALSNPDDDTYRKNLARYLDTKDLVLTSNSKNELYITDKDGQNPRPVTKTFVGDMIGSAPEILGAIVGSRFGGIYGAGVGSVIGDSVQQYINSEFLGEKLTGKERMYEGGKSAGLGVGGEVAGRVVGHVASRAVTPLKTIDHTATNANTRLFNRYGVEATPATKTGHRGLASFEEVMQKGSLGGKSIIKAKEAEISGIERVARDLFENKMGGAGDTFQTGSELIESIIKNKDVAKAHFNTAYRELAEQAGGRHIPINNLKEFAKRIIEKSKTIPALKGEVDNFAQTILDSPDVLNYDDFAKLRTRIGRKISDTTVTGQSGDQPVIKRLYKAINKDFDEIFKNTDMLTDKRNLDKLYVATYKEPFENSFVKSAIGAGERQGTDPEKIGGLITRSSNKAKTAASTADDFAPSPEKSMAASADYITEKSMSPSGDMSLAKMKTTLQKATGADELFRLNRTLTGTDLRAIKDDVVKMAQLSGQNSKVANTSGTAWMNEMIKSKGDPLGALLGFVTDTGMSATYQRKLFQRWLTNGIIDQTMHDALVKGMGTVGQVGSRVGE